MSSLPSLSLPHSIHFSLLSSLSLLLLFLILPLILSYSLSLSISFFLSSCVHLFFRDSFMIYSSSLKSQASPASCYVSLETPDCGPMPGLPFHCNVFLFIDNSIISHILSEPVLFYKICFFLFYVYVCLPTCAFVHMCVSVHRIQKNPWNWSSRCLWAAK